MDGIKTRGILLDPVDTSRLGVAIVGNVVNMAFDRISEISHYCMSSPYPYKILANATIWWKGEKEIVAQALLKASGETSSINL